MQQKTSNIQNKSLSTSIGSPTLNKTTNQYKTKPFTLLNQSRNTTATQGQQHTPRNTAHSNVTFTYANNIDPRLSHRPIFHNQHRIVLPVVPTETFNIVLPVQTHKVIYINKPDVLPAYRASVSEIQRTQQRYYSEQKLRNAVKRQQKYDQILKRSAMIVDQFSNDPLVNNFTFKQPHRKQHVIEQKFQSDTVPKSEYQNVKLQAQKWKDLYLKLQKVYQQSNKLKINRQSNNQNENKTTQTTNIQKDTLNKQIKKQNVQINQKINKFQHKLKKFYKEFQQKIVKQKDNTLKSVSELVQNYRKDLQNSRNDNQAQTQNINKQEQSGQNIK